MSEEIKNSFTIALVTKQPEIIASVWILNRVPVLFNQDSESYAHWRHELATGLEVDASALIITGSGAFGISLNPYKNYRSFDGASDIDVAVISEHHFNVAWRTLRNLGSAIHKLSPPAKQSVIEHVHKYIYWGTIATDRILNIFPFGSEWQNALNKMAGESFITKDRTIKARIYKDFDSLRAYQVNNLKNLRTQELEKGLP